MTGRVPVVSVIMPVYRNDDYLAESIGSILEQTFRDLELILICDDPSEKIRIIISEFQKGDDRIHVIFNERKGLVSALNEGFSLATGTYIARMDADDISYPNRLEKQVAFMEAHPGCALVATQIEWIDESGTIIGHWMADLQADTSDKIRKILPRKNCLAHPTILIKRSIANKYLYDFRQKHVEDYDLWLRMASENQVLCKLPEILLKLRIHESSITSRSMKASQGFDKNWCKIRYLVGQISMGRISFFNMKVFFYLLTDSVIWFFKYLYRMVNSLVHFSPYQRD
jgi:glycosyltransferase involved in cell wall biosynthesis